MPSHEVASKAVSSKAHGPSRRGTLRTHYAACCHTHFSKVAQRRGQGRGDRSPGPSGHPPRRPDPTRARPPHSFWSLGPSRARPRASGTPSTAGLMGRRRSIPAAWPTHPDLRTPASTRSGLNPDLVDRCSRCSARGDLWGGGTGRSRRVHWCDGPPGPTAPVSARHVLEKELALQSRRGTLCRWPWRDQRRRNSRVP